MTFAEFPATAAWSHAGLRTGFEVCAFTPLDDGYRVVGSTSAVEAQQAWWVQYEILLDATFVTRRAVVRGWSGRAEDVRVIEADGLGHWLVDGRRDAGLDGCLDVDLESSAMTNTLPLRRSAMVEGRRVSAPAAYVRVDRLRAERLEQEYTRLPDGVLGPACDYRAPAFSFACRIDYDRSGLVLDYPGIAQRVPL